MPKYRVTITETITNCSTLVMEAKDPEFLSRRIEDDGEYDPDQLEPQTVEVSAFVHGEAESAPEGPFGAARRLIDYLWDEEQKHFEAASADEREGHIFQDLMQFSRWLQEGAHLKEGEPASDIP
jgi:hypothetical protein